MFTITPLVIGRGKEPFPFKSLKGQFAVLYKQTSIDSVVVVVFVCPFAILLSSFRTLDCHY